MIEKSHSGENIRQHLEKFCASCTTRLFPGIASPEVDQRILNNLASLHSGLLLDPTERMLASLGNHEERVFASLAPSRPGSLWVAVFRHQMPSFCLLPPPPPPGPQLLILCCYHSVSSFQSRAGDCATLLLSPCHCSSSCWFLSLPPPSHNLVHSLSSKLLLHPV